MPLSPLTRAPRRWTAVVSVAVTLGVALAVVVSTSRVKAQATGIAHWVYDTVAAVGTNDCGPYVRLNGLGVDPSARPVVAWSEQSQCGGNPLERWSRKEDGAWQTFIVRPTPTPIHNGDPNDPGDAHEFALAPDGTPWLVFDWAFFDGFYSFRTNLSLDPTGGAAHDLFGFLVPRQHPTYGHYALSFGANATVPSAARDNSESLGGGRVFLNGATVLGSLWAPAGLDYVRSPDGTDHMLVGDGTAVMHIDATGHSTTVANIEDSYDTQIESDAAGVLHAVIRGYNRTSPSDRGELGYLTSHDGGVSWSPPEILDATHEAGDPVLTLDANGVPAVAYWRWGGGGLYYATRVDGTWQTSRIFQPRFWDGRAVRRLRLGFDERNRAVVAFWDWTTKLVRIARPVLGNDAAVPVDLAVTVLPREAAVIVGTEVPYTVSVANRGVRDASGVTLTVTMPSNFSYLSATPQPISVNGPVLTFAMGDVHAGDASSVVITTRATAIGAVPMHAVAVAREPESPTERVGEGTSAVRDSACFLSPSALVGRWPADSSAYNILYPNAEQESLRPIGNTDFGAGRFGRAFDFDGVTGYRFIDTPFDATEYFPRGDFSMQAWIRTSRTTGLQVIGGKGRAADNIFHAGPGNYYFGVSDGHLAAWFNDANDGTTSVLGPHVVADGAFHHVAVVRDLTQLQLNLYIDGALEASSSLVGGASGPFSSQATRFSVGMLGTLYGTGPNYFFAGQIDELSVFDRALSTDELSTYHGNLATEACGAPPANHPPVAVGDAVGTPQDTAINIDVLANDHDEDGDALSVTHVTQGAHGAVSISADGSVRYVPALGFSGPDRFSYTASDGRGGGAGAFVDVLVTPVLVTLTDLRVSGPASPRLAAAGDTLTLTFVASNAGPDSATAARVFFTMPAGLTFVAAAPAATSTQGPVVRVDLGAMAANTQRTVTLNVRVEATAIGTAIISAEVTGDETDTDLNNNAVLATIDVRAAACAAPRTGLVALWTGDGTTVDSSGNGYGGVAHGGVTYRPRIVNEGFLLNGTNGYVEVNDVDDALYPHDASFTLMAWVKTTSLSTMVVTSKQEAGGSAGFTLTLSNGRLVASLRDVNGASSGPLTGVHPVADGKYHHVAVSRNGLGDITLFVDGVVDAFVAGPLLGDIGDTNHAPDPMLIGARLVNGLPIGYFSGSLDEVALFSRALSATELQDVVSQRTNADCGGAPQDALAPELDGPSSVTVEATGPAGAVATYSVDATDNVDGAVPVTCTRASGSLFPLGDTLVTCSAMDDRGNTSSRTFPVSVVDTTKPTLTLPANITANPPAAGSPSVVVTFTASATDIVDGTVQVACAPASGSAFTIGATTVTCTATDHANNTRQGSFTVTVPQPSGNAAPIVVNPGPQQSFLGDEIRLPIVATDPEGDVLRFTAGTTPPQNTIQPLTVPGLTIDRATGLITGVTNVAGSRTILIHVSDGHGHTVDVTFTWNVINHGHPVVLPIDRQVNYPGQSASLQVTGRTVPAGGALTYSATGLPNGLTINATTGLITGTPVAGDMGKEFRVTVVVTDTFNLTDSTEFLWLINFYGQVDFSVTVGPFYNLAGRYAFTTHYDGPLSLGRAQLTIEITQADEMHFDCVGSQHPSVHLSKVTLQGRLVMDVTLARDESMTCTSSLFQQATGDVLAAVLAKDRVDGFLTNNISLARLPFTSPSTTVNHRPVMAPIPDQDGIGGDDAALEVIATDADGDSLRYGIVAGPLPPGLALGGFTGAIGPRLSSIAAGDYPVTVAVTDGRGVSLRSFNWHVTERSILLENPGPQDDAVGRDVHVDLNVRDRFNRTITVVASGLPAGLALRSSPDRRTWWIDGQPLSSSLGTHSVTLTASSIGPSISRTFTWTIGPDLDPTFPQPAAQSTAGGQTVSFGVHATDPYGYPVTYALNSPLPPGIVWHPWGSFTGTVPFGLSGIYPVTVTATSGQHHVSRTFLWTILYNEPPAVLNPGLQYSVAGTFARLRIIATDDQGPGLTFGLASTLPAGLALDPVTGVIEGTLDPLASTRTVEVYAEDRYGIRTSVRFQWGINRPPVFSVSDRLDIVGQVITLNINISDDDNTQTWTATGLPPGITGPAQPVLRGGLRLTGTLTTAGTWTTTITITDARGASRTHTFVWTVMSASGTDLEVVGANASVPSNTIVPPDAVLFSFEVRNLGPGATTGVTFAIDQPASLIGPANGRVVYSCQKIMRNNSGSWVNYGGGAVSWQNIAYDANGMTMTGLAVAAPNYGVRCSMQRVQGHWPTFTGHSVTVTATATAPNEGYPPNNTATRTKSQ